MSVEVTTLPSGIKVVSEYRRSLQTVAIGVWVDVGARYEPVDINGHSHFLEHMLFKGTERRGARAIAEEIENVGGHMNAYTSRDHTTFYARVMQEEPFGPLAIVNPVGSLDEAIKRANSVPYGLAAYGFTNRADYADRMVDHIEAGNLSINTLEASLPETPFGGVKSSGYGREGGAEGLHHYTVVKNVSHAMSIV